MGGRSQVGGRQLGGRDSVQGHLEEVQQGQGEVLRSGGQRDRQALLVLPGPERGAASGEACLAGHLLLLLRPLQEHLEELQVLHLLPPHCSGQTW